MPMPKVAVPPHLETKLLDWITAKYGHSLYARQAETDFAQARIALGWIVERGWIITSWRDITPGVVAAFVETRAAAGYTYGDTRRKLAAVREWVCNEEALERTGPIVSRYIECRQRDRAKKPRALTADQADWLLGRSVWIHNRAQGLGSIAADWPPMAFRLFCLLGIDAGLRPAEALWLCASELRLNAPVPHYLLEDTECRDLKNEHASTPVELTPRLANALQDFVSQRGPEAPPPLFAVKRGGRWTKPRYKKIWRLLKDESGCDYLNAYALRRTFATRRVEAGLDVQGLLAVMRHTSVRTAQRYYVAHGLDNPVSLETGRAG